VSRATRNAARYLICGFSLLVLLPFANVAYGQNTVSTVAGSAPPNNVSPAGAPIEGPQSVARDASGNLYVVNDNGVIYKVPFSATAPSNMAIYAGNNTRGFSPNGTLATSALTNEPIGAAIDGSGNFYFSDQNNCVVREIVASSGVINTVAGTPGVCNYSGDTHQATSAQLSFPQGVAIDSSGTLLYIADIGNSIVRLVNLTTGIITTYAGEPQIAGVPTNGALATSTLLNGPVAVAVDTGGNVFIADQNDNVICRVDATSKVLAIVAGTGTANFSGDGGPATSATLNSPDGVAVDGTGNIYISDYENSRVREVFASGPNAGEIQTIVGTTTSGFNGDGFAGTSTELTNPSGLFVDPTTGNLWIADY
jgi:sugar lactone lactonase YvrE